MEAKPEASTRVLTHSAGDLHDTFQSEMASFRM